MWNGTDIPLAYLITFRCYGTWLHGDERGSINRFNNQYHSPYIPANEKWQQYNSAKLVCEPVILKAAHRSAVELAIRETCSFRNWELHTINIRTNHIHVVVNMGAKLPELALNALKANATRQLKQEGLWLKKHSPWADKGSNRYLWNNRSVDRAIDYVINGQGDELPEFD